MNITFGTNTNDKMSKKFLRSRTKMLFTLLSVGFLAIAKSQSDCQPWQVWNGAECVAQEPVSCSGSTPYLYGGSCYGSCPSGTYAYSSDCVSTCPSGTQPENGNCVSGTGCSSYSYNGQCVSACPTGTYYYNNVCYDTCPTNTIVSVDSCIEECPYGSYMSNGQCVTGCRWTFRGECSDECWKSGNYIKFPGSNECVTSCPKVYEMKNNTCLDACAPGQKLVGTGCVDKCPMQMPYANGNRCDMSCPVYVDTTTYNCVDSCPSGTTLNGKRCEKDSVPTCNTNQYLDASNTCRDIPSCSSTQFLGSDYLCYDAPITSVSCNSTQYINSNGTCVNFPERETCMENEVLSSDGKCIVVSEIHCNENQWYFNNTCISACKDGEFLDMNGKCNDPQKMCHESLPGGYYNTTTQKCDCPLSFWITRIPNAQPPKSPIQCVQTRMDNPPRIDCQSFIPYTVYITEFDTCVCNTEYPVIVQNTDDWFLPFKCASQGTTTNVKPCDREYYFDFLKGECVKGDIYRIPTFTPIVTSKPDATWSPRPSYTAIPSIIVRESMTPKPSQTMTAMPSRRPSQSASLTRSPKPSDRPGSPSSSISVSRTPRPSAAIYADVSRKPLPSVKPLPPPLVAKSPAPSPWPKKVEVVLEPEEKPAYIEAKVSVSGGNATEMTKPEKIQEMQASLACTLRMPLENILITNITYVDEKGVIQKLDVDPTKFMMAGDGSTECYDMKKPVNSTGGRLLRSLQATGAIEVDYAIVAPSDDILAMDTTQMQQVISTSPIMIQAANSVGGTKLTATSLEFLRSQISPSASPSPLATTGLFVDLRAAIGGGIGAIALLVGIAAAFIMYSSQKKEVQQVVTQKEQEVKNRVMVIVQEQHHMNPIVNMRPTLGQELPIDFSPEQTRRSDVPLRATNKGPASWGTRV